MMYSVRTFGFWLLRSGFKLSVLAIMILPALLWFLTMERIDSERWTTHWLDTLTIQASAQDGAFVLGRERLGQRQAQDSASGAHLMVLWRDGRWHLRNVAEDRRALLIYEKDRHLMRKWPLLEGDAISLAGQGPRLTVGKVKDTAGANGEVHFTYTSSATAQPAVALKVLHNSGFLPETKMMPLATPLANGVGTQDPGKLLKQHQSIVGWIGDLADCVSRLDGKDRARRELQAYVGRTLSGLGRLFRPEPPTLTLVRIGGFVSCRDRIALPSLELPQIRVIHEGDDLFLTAPAEVFARIVVHQADGNDKRLSEVDWPVDGTSALRGSDLGKLKGVVLGRTRYDVMGNGGTLVFKASANRHLFFDGGDEFLDAAYLKASLECMVRSENATTSCVRSGLGVPNGFDLKANVDNPKALPEHNWLCRRLVPLTSDFGWIGRVTESICGLTSVRAIPHDGTFIEAVEVGGMALALLIVLRTLSRQNWAPYTTKGKWLRSVLNVRFLQFLAPLSRVSPVIAIGLSVAIAMFLFAARTFSKLDIFQADASNFLILAGWTTASLLILSEVVRSVRLRHAHHPFLLVAFWTVLGCLLMWGSVTLHQLSAGAARTNWARFDHAHQWTMLVFIATLTIFLCVNNVRWRAIVGYVLLGRSTTKRALFSWAWIVGWLKPPGGLRLMLLGLIAFLSATFFIAGSEEGLGDLFQPIEFGKFAFLVITVTSIVWYERETRYSRSLTAKAFLNVLFVAVAIGFFILACFVIVPVGLNDQSPVAIMATLLAIVYLATVVMMHVIRQYRIAALEDSSPPSITYRVQGDDAEHGFTLRTATRVEMASRQLAATIRKRLNQRKTLNRGHILLTAVAILAFGMMVGIALIYGTTVNANRSDAQKALAFSMIERRVAVAYDHDAHPEWSGQLRLAWRAIKQGREDSDRTDLCMWAGKHVCDASSSATAVFTGTASQAGASDAAPEASVPSPKQFNGASLMAVPAIQDDMIAAFFVARFGIDSAKGLLLLQVLFFALGVYTSVATVRFTTGNLREETERLLLGSIAFGATILISMHWTISWFNVVSWFPIMGQPMSLISYARSHTLMMCLPAIIAILMALRLGPPSDETKDPIYFRLE